MGVVEHVAHRHDPAHRVTEQVDLVDAQRVDHRREIADQRVERVGGFVAGIGRLGMAALVVSHHTARLRQGRRDVIPVRRAAGVAMHEHKGNRALALVDDAQVHRGVA